MNNGTASYFRLKLTSSFLGMVLLFNLITGSAQSLAPKSVINIGTTSALTGNNKVVGQNIVAGLKLYIDKTNAEGGTDGHPINFIIMDDAFDPERAATNVHQLTEKDKVVALLGDYGTITNSVTLPIIIKNKTLLFAPITGASQLYKIPPEHYVFTFRAGYQSATRDIIPGLLSAKIRPDQMGFFSSNDALAIVIEGSINALQSMGYHDTASIPYGRYASNTENVENALATLITQAKKPLKAIIMAGTADSNDKFMQLAAKEFPQAYFILVSGIVPEKKLSQSLDSRVVAIQFMPLIDSNLPGITEYKESLKKYGHGLQQNPYSLEGYFVAKLFVMALKKAVSANNISSEGIIEALERMKNIDIGVGIPISFSPSNHQALHSIWPSLFKNGKYEALEWEKLSKNDLKNLSQ